MNIGNEQNRWLRPHSCRQKNWLVAGSERSGQRAAAIQTLFGTAQLNGIHPAKWLTETLTKLPIWLSSRTDELLPLTTEFIESLKQKKITDGNATRLLLMHGFFDFIFDERAAFTAILIT